jgi:glutamate/tyrosine decarboxylase-like PLP-dependent enzyme
VGNDVRMSEFPDLIMRAAREIVDYRAGVGEDRVFPDLDSVDLRAAFGGPLPDGPTASGRVIDDLVAAAGPGLVATTGPRYFGFVIGGALDSATAAELLTTGWDQPAYNALSAPAAAVAEEASGAWLKELLGIPESASFGFVTGAQGANTVGLAAARHQVLGAAGHDVERDGLIGAPRVRVIAGVERHATIDRALRLLGFGSAVVEEVAADANGAIDVGDLTRVLASQSPGPTIVVVQSGNVNTGACDDLAGVTAAARGHGAWVHVDGAFGLWAAASPATRHLVAGIEAADSWGCDGHKWLNVPYDSGYVFCAHPEAHAAAMAYTAAYLALPGAHAVRAPGDFVPESSRRARGFATWAALRELGRNGVAELVDRCCALARRFAEQLGAVDGIDIVNDVVLNQVLVRFGSDVDADRDATADRVLDAVQRSGECWMGGTTWRGMRLMRISVSNWSTTEHDVDRSVAAVIAALRDA